MTTLAKIREKYQVYRIGIDEIDEEHFAMLALAETAAEEHDRETLLAIFDKLIEALNAHIEHEDVLMRECNFPFYAYHTRLHNELREKVREGVCVC